MTSPINEKYLSFYRECYGMKNNATLELLASNSIEHQFQKKEYLSNAGFVQSVLYILDTGIIRGVSNLGEKESTDCIVSTRGTVLSTTPFPSAKEPSQISLQALTDCTVLGLPINLIEDNLLKHPEITKVAISMAKQSVSQHAELSRVRTMKAEDRIRWAVKKYGAKMDEVNDEVIATYLGMDRAHYSRIKKTLDA